MPLFAKNIRGVTLEIMMAIAFPCRKEPKPSNKRKKSVCTEENSCVQAVLCICFPGRLAWDSMIVQMRV